MEEHVSVSEQEQLARFRFSIIGGLLADPPQRGQRRQRLQELADKDWIHPGTGQAVRYGFSTLERWYYQVLKSPHDPVGTLQRKVRCDCGRQKVLTPAVQAVLRQLRQDHPRWSYLLVYENLVVMAEQGQTPGLERDSVPSYGSVRRYMKTHGLQRRWGRRRGKIPASEAARHRFEAREVRSYEATHCGSLWHLDYHHGSRPVLSPQGQWVRPRLLGTLDDYSRLICHGQWFYGENTEELVHGYIQALQKRGVPWRQMTDNGSAMKAGEFQEGLARLGIQFTPTLPRCPQPNGKIEILWAAVEGRLMSMLEGIEDLTLDLLNRATQAWIEMEYNRRDHCELKESPLQRWIRGPHCSRPCPAREELRLAFMIQQSRALRHSDGTVCLHGRRLEVPGRFGQLKRLSLRYARWDLSRVYVVDPATGKVLDRLYPQDKAANADRRRRRRGDRSDPRSPAEPSACGMAPLLRRLMEEYAATGLPPAFIPHARPPQEPDHEADEPTP